ncbi:MAG TPA: hypothetical protein PK771_09975 [Spirochaetota bacterium]|nr:hypothetical protein [Spirochaetota bacterium]
MKLFLIILFLFQIFFLVSNDNDNLITANFFSHHIHEGDLDNLPFKEIPFHSIRLWDADVRWNQIEPVKGIYIFDRLDDYVSKANSKNIDIIMTLGMSTDWSAKRKWEKSLYGKEVKPSEPENIDDWRNYVKTLGTRYKGKIKYWEIWNEPDFPFFYSGSIPMMVKLTKEANEILKSIDPENKIISPSVSGWKGWFGGLIWLDLFLKFGGKKYIDIIGFHLYTGKIYKPENMVSYINLVKQIRDNNCLSHLPIWNTETNYHYKNISKKEAISHIAKIYLINLYCGIERVFWYSWGFGNDLGGMVYKDTKELTYEGEAYYNLSKWLVNKQVVKWEIKNNIRICQLKNNDKFEYIIWKDSNSTFKYKIPKSWDVNTMVDLFGNKTTIDKNIGSIEINKIPLLLIN